MSLGKTVHEPQGKVSHPNICSDFCHPHCLGFRRLWSNRGEKSREGGRHSVMLYQILLMIIIKHSELKERQKESLYPDGA